MITEAIINLNKWFSYLEVTVCLETHPILSMKLRVALWLVNKAVSSNHLLIGYTYFSTASAISQNHKSETKFQKYGNLRYFNI